MNWLLLKNSLVVGGATALLSAGFGSLAALCLSAMEGRGRMLILALALASLAVPPFLATNCWLHYLGYTGAWRGWLPLDIFSIGGTVWILSLLLWPIPMLALLGAWRRLEPAQLESDMAVSGRFLMLGLLLPLGRSALVQSALLVFVLALNNFAVPAILQVKVFPAEMWVRFNTTFDIPGTLALSWPLVAAPLLLLAWLHREAMPWPHLESAVSGKLLRRQLGAAWFGVSCLVTLLLCFFSIGLPLLQLLLARATWAELRGAAAAGHAAAWHSAAYAAIAATLAVAPGALIRKVKGRSSLREGGSSFWRSMFGFRPSLILWLPFLLPGVLLGIALIVLFNHPWSAFLYQTPLIVILAYVVRYLAWGQTAATHAFRSVDPALSDAATLDGASRWQLLRHVLWPQVGPQIAAAWYIVFLLCLWDVESMVLVTPPGGETLALRIFNLLHYGHNAQVNALCVMLLAIALAPWAGWGIWRAAQGWKNSRPGAAVVSILAACCLLATGCGGDSASSHSLNSALFNRVEILGSRGAGVGQFNKPRSVAVDSRDNLYVVDMTGRVQRFASNGVWLLSWQMPVTDKGCPKGLCCDREGNVVVNEPHYSRVSHYSPEGVLAAQWGKHGTNAGQLAFPRAVAVNSRNEIWVSEYGITERAQRFSARGGGLLGGFGRMGTGPGEFNRPEGLCVDARDRLHVADSCNHRIQVFDDKGAFLRAFGKAGSGPGELGYPYDICVDSAGLQYVCEFGNSRIQVFDDQDRPVEIIGGPGAAPGRFNNPWGVALDSAGNLYVADSQNHRVQKFVRRP